MSPASLQPGLGATYRLQLRPGFGFAEAATALPYLARLGIETVYLSPVAEAVPGSQHGYDGTDPTSLRAELGGEGAYVRLVGACAEHGLGICVDLVPNHLSTWPHGPWWRRLLAEGRDSEMGEVFDVDWDAGPPAARGKVALPLLDRPLAEAAEAGLVRLGVRSGEPVVLVGAGGGSCGGPEDDASGAIDLPVAPGSVDPGVALDATGEHRNELFDVLAVQHYRLVDWHDNRDRNYRRFFDIDGLVGVRVEIPRVFDATHALVRRLAERAWLSALRVDHVDGLRDPARYLQRLQAATGVPIVVEKILTRDERLRADWPVVGTTGYETIDDVGGVLVDPHGLDRLVAAARADGDEETDTLTVECRRLVATTSFPGEFARAAQRLAVRTDAFREVAVRLRRYRTYLDEAGDDAGQAAVWRRAGDEAVTEAGGANGASPAAVVDAVLDPERRNAALGVQQLTGALMAKGVEDTAWYRLSGPLAFCEVGGEPGLTRHDAVARWHRRAADRVAPATHGLVPGTTHDTKRAQDVRCRLYALTEMAHDFGTGLRALRAALDAALEADGGVGDLAFETRVAAQLALGVLPAVSQSEPALADEAARLAGALEKGAREAKRRSSWLAPDTGYETRLRRLAEAILADGAARLRSCFGPALDEALRLGAVNSLSSIVLRHALPGLPDCYQGDETWNLSLVDPDNRRPVDLRALARELDEIDTRSDSASGGASAPAGPDRLAGAATLAGELRRGWRDGRVKQFVTSRCLRARRSPRGRALTPDAAYQRLAAAGPAAGSVLCFARTTAPEPLRRSTAPGGAAPGTRDAWAVAVVTRLAARLDAPDDDLPAGLSYAGTTVVLPEGAPGTFEDALSGTTVRAPGGTLELDDVLSSLPVALLLNASDAGR